MFFERKTLVGAKKRQIRGVCGCFIITKMQTSRIKYCFVNRLFIRIFAKSLDNCLALNGAECRAIIFETIVLTKTDRRPFYGEI